MELVDAALDLANFGLAFDDHGLLEGELLWGELGVQDLSLTLGGSGTGGASLLLAWAGLPGQGQGRGMGGDSRSMLVLLYCELHAVDYGALPFCADLLRALEGDKGKLEVVRGLLQ